MSGEKPRHEARLASLVFVVHEGWVLLERRPATSDRFAGQWDAVGGHVEAGEDIEAAARRELQEETGLDLSPLHLRGVIHESGLLGHHYVVFLFVAECPPGAARPAARAGEGVGELAWHPAGSLDGLPLVPDLKVLLPRLLEAREPLFVTERYDGSDVPVALAVGGQDVPLRSP